MSDDVDIVSPKRHHSTKQPSNNLYKGILGVIAALIIAGLSFYAGIAYQKGHSSNPAPASATSSNLGGGGFARRFGGGHTLGTVSAISSTSISIQTAGGASDTYSITASTVITDSGSDVTYSDIQDGDTVLVITSSTTSTTATRILVNPSLGGFGGGGNGSTNSGSNPSLNVN